MFDQHVLLCRCLACIWREYRYGPPLACTCGPVYCAKIPNPQKLMNTRGGKGIPKPPVRKKRRKKRKRR